VAGPFGPGPSLRTRVTWPRNGRKPSTQTQEHTSRKRQGPVFGSRCLRRRHTPACPNNTKTGLRKNIPTQRHHGTPWSRWVVHKCYSNFVPRGKAVILATTALYNTRHRASVHTAHDTRRASLRNPHVPVNPQTWATSDVEDLNALPLSITIQYLRKYL